MGGIGDGVKRSRKGFGKVVGRDEYAVSPEK